MSIVTRHGDRGETSLLYGGRVPKDDLHTEAYGTLDEAVSALGLARALCHDPVCATALLDVQRDLFTVGAELATGEGHHADLARHFPTVDDDMTHRLDVAVAALEAEVELPKSFVIPGGHPVAAAIDLGRTLVRRAERRAVSLARTGALENPEVVRYLNRCSDYLFMLARAVEAQAGTLLPKGRSERG